MTPASGIDPVRGARFAFDVSCMGCGLFERFGAAPTFAALAQRMEASRWRVGTESGRRKPVGALRDLMGHRTCPECSSDVGAA